MKGRIRTNKPFYKISDSYLSRNKSINNFLWQSDNLKTNQEFIKNCIYHSNNNIKYNGKYAFIRILHSQEIVSSFFSFLSAVSAFVAIFCAYSMMHKYKRCLSSTSYNTPFYEYGFVLICVLSVHCITWLGSFIFHIRDCYLTQCIDYFGAILSISSTIILSLQRLSISSGAVRIVLSVFIVGHVVYMHFIQFDYLYNSVACGFLFSCNACLWILWYTRVSKHPYSRLLKLGIIGTIWAVCFQVIDFGPIYFLLDSHALWHILGWIFSTILYVFIVVDMHILLANHQAHPTAQ